MASMSRATSGVPMCSKRALDSAAHESATALAADSRAACSSGVSGSGSLVRNGATPSPQVAGVEPPTPRGSQLTTSKWRFTVDENES